MANDLVYFRDNTPAGIAYQGVARLSVGECNIESLATEIARAMNEVSFLPDEYNVTYTSKLGRYEFVNPSTAFNFAFLMYAKQTQEVGANIISTLFHVFKKMATALGDYLD